jgi:hypothetical protein
MRTTKTRRTEQKAPEVKGLEHLYIPTGKFEDAWRFWTEVAGGKAVETWGSGERKSGVIAFAGQSIVLGGDEEREEDEELGYPVRHDDGLGELDRGHLDHGVGGLDALGDGRRLQESDGEIGEHYFFLFLDGLDSTKATTASPALTVMTFAPQCVVSGPRRIFAPRLARSL